MDDKKTGQVYLHQPPASGREAAENYRFSASSFLNQRTACYPVTEAIRPVHLAFPTSCLVFWPSDLVNPELSPEHQRFYLCGWSFPGGPGEVVTVVADVIEAASLDMFAATRHHHLSEASISERSRPTLQVVGELIHHSPSLPSPSGETCNIQETGTQVGFSSEAEILHQPSLWLTAQAQGTSDALASQAFPNLVRVTVAQTAALGHESEAGEGPSSTSITCINFRSPDPSMLRFFSLEPIELSNFSDRPGAMATGDLGLGAKMEDLLAGNTERWFEITGGFPAGSGPGAGVRKAIECINDVHRVRIRVQRNKSRGQVGSRVILLMPRASRQLTFQVARTYQAIKTALAPLLASRGPRPIIVAGKAFVDTSCFAQQLHLRLSQVASFPSSAARLRLLRRRDLINARDSSARYIECWNGLWLIANDLILGWAAGTLLVQHYSSLATSLATFIVQWSIQGLVSACQWLDNWPGGLKLNTELSSFYLDMYVGLIVTFEGLCLQPAAKRLSSVIWALGIIGKFGGLSLQISFIVDLVRLSTLHIKFLHVIGQKQYRAFLDFLSYSLHLFRGKKRSVLSPRKEFVATQFELDQLLLGTILFTLAMFLFPTVAVYHYLFAIVIACVEASLAALDVATRALNHVPLLPLMLLLKDPARLPAGIAFIPGVESQDAVGQGLRHARLTLQSRPISIQQVFRGYSRHLQPLSAIPRMALSVLTGDEIARQ